MNWIRLMLRRFFPDRNRAAEIARQRESHQEALLRASEALAEMQRLEQVARDGGR